MKNSSTRHGLAELHFFLLYLPPVETDSIEHPGLWASLYIDYDWFGQTGTDTFLWFWLVHQPGVNVDEDQLYEDLFPTGGEFPQLTKLCVDLASEYIFGYDFQGYPPYALKNARSLHQLHFERVPWMLTIPYETLKIYSTENVTVSECIEVLRNAINLSSSTFSLIPDTPQDPITSLSPLVNLRDLTLSESVRTAPPLLAMNLLRHLTVPSLNHLTLKFEAVDLDMPPAVDISEFVFFTSRSLHRLEKLTLCFLPTSETVLVQCLQDMPCITTLRIQLYTPIDNVLDRLANDRDFLPRLEYLHIIHGTPPWSLLEYDGPTPDRLFGMLSSRRHPSDVGQRPVQLQAFQFEIYDASYAANLFIVSVVSDPRYGQFEDSGMTLSIGTLNWGSMSWWVDI
ncbi:hypothetical protein MSAN_00718500 [Mycena sanguinolenta]|uniref:Uncharacterized protein n=1 Tax=Mycena sanguinolenta TaxID=230812 RepID=A0A8H6Z1E7_9AGAR|nr:hypothetical protein MSAN_00718500 [Mycena sanguinolenta]